MRDIDLPPGARVLVLGAMHERDRPRWNEIVHFTEALGAHLMRFDDPPIVLITGGRSGERFADEAIVRGARQELGSQALADRAATFDTRSSTKADRQTFADTRHVEPLEVRRERRFEMTLRSDAVLSVAGHDRVREVMTLASALGRPALPVPFTGELSWEL
jgi:hypothetical protein